jgi:hypothetical protein
VNLPVAAPTTRETIWVTKDMLTVHNTLQVLRFIVSVKVMLTDVFLPVDFFTDFVPPLLSILLGHPDANQLLIKFTCAIM